MGEVGEPSRRCTPSHSLYGMYWDWNQVQGLRSMYRAGYIIRRQVYKVGEIETSPREDGHLVLPCMDRNGMCWLCWALSQVLELTSLFQTWDLASTQVYESKRAWSPCLTLYEMVWHVLSSLPSVGAHKLVPDLGSCKHTSVQRYVRERQVQERLVTLSYLVWIGMGCVEWYPKCRSPQACSRLGLLQAHKCTRYVRGKQVQQMMVTLP